MRRLLARRDARIYLAGQVFSLFGDSSLWLAMGIWVRTLTGSNAQAGLVFFFYTAPSLLAPALGLLADRIRRRPLLLVVNAATAGAVLALLAVHGPGQVWLIDAVMLAYGVSAQVIGPAQSALLTVMVPAELLPDANAALRTVQEILRLAGPLAGASLYVAVGPHVVAVVDAVSFAFPVASLLLLRVREPVPQPAKSRWASQVAAGVRHIWRTAELRQVIIAAGCTTMVFGFAETTIYAITTDGLRRPAAFAGALGAVQGIGAVSGGLSAAVQRLTPPGLQGRAYAAAEVLITTPQTISIAAGAALIAVVAYQWLLLAMAGIFAATAACLLTRPEHRRPGAASEEARAVTGLLASHEGDTAVDHGQRGGERGDGDGCAAGAGDVDAVCQQMPGR